MLSVTTTILIYKKKAESRNWRTTKCPIYKLDINQTTILRERYYKNDEYVRQCKAKENHNRRQTTLTSFV